MNREERLFCSIEYSNNKHNTNKAKRDWLVQYNEKCREEERWTTVITFAIIIEICIPLL